MSETLHFFSLDEEIYIFYLTGDERAVISLQSSDSDVADWSFSRLSKFQKHRDSFRQKGILQGQKVHLHFVSLLCLVHGAEDQLLGFYNSLQKKNIATVIRKKEPMLYCLAKEGAKAKGAWTKSRNQGTGTNELSLTDVIPLENNANVMTWETGGPVPSQESPA